MTLPRSAAEVLSEHVVFSLECIDRMYLNMYQPRLQHELGVIGYLHEQLGCPVNSTAPLAKVSERFAAQIHRFVAQQQVPLVAFVKGQRKDDVMLEHLASFQAAGRTEGVLFVGRAQEKNRVFRTETRRDRRGDTYPWIVKTTGVINQWYFYCVDADFGPFFIKFSGYFPYTGKLCLNGNHWAQRQATAAGIGFTALDNGFAALDDPADLPRLQAICDQLGPEEIDALARKWLARLPHPFSPADRAAGYRYDLSVLQAEFSLTHVLDKTVSGRIFFEQVIRDNLDIGRPDQVGLVFDRKIIRKGPRATPGRFRTRVITQGVTPSLHIDYKNSKIKQYHKLGQALRTETTINETRDFGIGKRLTNLPALREIGFTANRRLLDVQQLSHDPVTGASAFRAATTPVITTTGARIPGLRFADPRVHALLAALCVHRLHPSGFTSGDLRAVVAELTGRLPQTISAGQMSYDLRRLRHHGLIERIPGHHRYRVTDIGLTDALFLTRAHDRLLRTGLAQLAQPDRPSPLRTADRAYRRALDHLADQAGLAA
jgi:hypothetical protein